MSKKEHKCPKCGGDMLNPEPMIKMSSKPMQEYAKCVDCDYLMTVVCEEEE